MKVLWVGDAIIQSGFSVVTHNICNELCTKCDLEVFGIRYDGRARNTYPYHIYPARIMGDIYSFAFAAEVVGKEKPDVVVIFNDDNIVAKYAKVIGGDASFVTLFPVNLLPVQKDILLSFSTNLNIRHVITYTKFSKQKLLEINPHIEVTPIYHGVHSGVFFPIPDAKQHLDLSGKFVVGQVGTNTYRKRLDLFMIGFAKFAKDKPDVRCLIHAVNDDIAYDLPAIAIDLGVEDKVIFSTEPITFEKMNFLYNVIDVCVNTSMGEGFGLPLIESAACGVPILCPNHGNLRDVWTKGADFIDIVRQEYIAGTKFVGDVINVDDFVSKLNNFYTDKSYLKRKGEDALEHSKSDKFLWKVVANKVYSVLQKANKQKISYISS